jgi:hypothetical protein
MKPLGVGSTRRSGRRDAGLAHAHQDGGDPRDRGRPHCSLPPSGNAQSDSAADAAVALGGHRSALDTRKVTPRTDPASSREPAPVATTRARRLGGRTSRVRRPIRYRGAGDVPHTAQKDAPPHHASPTVGRPPLREPGTLLTDRRDRPRPPDSAHVLRLHSRAVPGRANSRKRRPARSCSRRARPRQCRGGP